VSTAGYGDSKSIREQALSKQKPRRSNLSGRFLGFRTESGTWRTLAPLQRALINKSQVRISSLLGLLPDWISEHFHRNLTDPMRKRNNSRNLPRRWIRPRPESSPPRVTGHISIDNYSLDVLDNESSLPRAPIRDRHIPRGIVREESRWHLHLFIRLPFRGSNNAASRSSSTTNAVPYPSRPVRGQESALPASLSTPKRVQWSC
jgi:hypothetical protein